MNNASLGRAGIYFISELYYLTASRTGPVKTKLVLTVRRTSSPVMWGSVTTFPYFEANFPVVQEIFTRQNCTTRSFHLPLTSEQGIPVIWDLFPNTNCTGHSFHSPATFKGTVA